MADRLENIPLDTKNNSVDNTHIQKMIVCPTILTGMSHEVRTYMNAIVAFSFLMGRNGCNETERQEFSDQILSSCEQLIGLFDNFINSAILETGNPKAELKICNVKHMFEELFCEFRDAIGKYSNNDITLVAENRSSEDLEIIMDSDKVLRVIRNLFQNSLKNTKSGYIKVGHYFRDNSMTFYVIDSGQGYFKCKEFLHTEDLNDSLTRYNDTFSAVNITLAKNLIEMMKGSIRIECNGLTGSAVYFTIPVKISKGSVSIDKYFNSTIAI